LIRIAVRYTDRLDRSIHRLKIILLHLEVHRRSFHVCWFIIKVKRSLIYIHLTHRLIHTIRIERKSVHIHIPCHLIITAIHTEIIVFPIFLFSSFLFLFNIIIQKVIITFVFRFYLFFFGKFKISLCIFDLLISHVWVEWSLAIFLYSWYHVGYCIFELIKLCFVDRWIC